MGKRELIALLRFSFGCIMIVVLVFLAVSWVCLQSVIVVFPDHTHLLFLSTCMLRIRSFALFLVYSFESCQLGKCSF